MPAIDFRGAHRAVSPIVAIGRPWLAFAAAFPLVATGAFVVTTPRAADAPAYVDLTAVAAAAEPMAPAPLEDAASDSVEVTLQRNDTLAH